MYGENVIGDVLGSSVGTITITRNKYYNKFLTFLSNYLKMDQSSEMFICLL